MWKEFFFLMVLISSIVGQGTGTLTPENQPSLQYQTCDSSGCTSSQGTVTIDANWRWIHSQSGSTNCYTGDRWDSSLCPDPVTCSRNCVVEGADYSGTYGVSSNGTELTLRFVTPGPYGKNVGSRLYLLENDKTYKLFKLKNREFSFDVDVSQLPCGLNGALYFVSMDGDGGSSRFPLNRAGAKYGTGYCDAQCPHDIKFIDGEANVLDWEPSPNNPNTGAGLYGTCCVELDIWEANQYSSAYTPHPCTVKGQYRCNGTECGDKNRYGGVCDKDGCDFNSFRMGVHNYFGNNMVVDTTKRFTVITQFKTTDGTDQGDLNEIRRIYVQNGKVIQNSAVNFTGLPAYDSITTKSCNDVKNFFGNNNDFAKKGGLKSMGDAMERGMVLVLSLWDDYAVYMLWLDSNYPTDQPPSKPGIARGPCPITSGRPQDVERDYPNSYVKYGNIKVGTIGSTLPSLVQCNTGIIVNSIDANLGRQVYIAQTGGTKYGGISVAGNSVTLQHNTRGYIASQCDNSFTPNTFFPIKLLDKTISFSVNLNQIGCGCNAAMYLVSMPAYNSNNQPDPTKCGDYYCDANNVCGIYCPEIDILEANNGAFQVTPHRCDSPQGHYYPHCDGGGCGINSYRTNPQAYGYGSQYTINTQQSFQVSMNFSSSQGVLSKITTTFSQNGRTFSVIHDPSRCGSDYLSSLTQAVSQGMTVALSYWGDTGSTMSWLDVPPCDINTPCNTAGQVTFSNFTLY